MTTPAFGSRRVIESLDSIARYLDQATGIAAQIPAVETISLDTKPVPVVPVPRLDTVLGPSGKPKIDLTTEVTPQNDVFTFDVSVTGENLSKPAQFTFKGVNCDAPTFTAEHLKETTAQVGAAPPKVVGFTATFKVTVKAKTKNQVRGIYDARVVNTDGRSDTLLAAFRIDISKKRPAAALGSAAD